MDHQTAEGITHAIDRWSTVVLGIATAVATAWVTLAKAIGPWLQRRRDMAAVEKRSVVELMQKQIDQLRADLDVARAETIEWQRKWSDLLHEKAQDAEKFVRVLEKLRGQSSAPPPTSR